MRVHSCNRRASSRFLAAAVLGALAAACAGGSSSLTGYDNEIGAWVGQDANVLVRVWGPPASTFTMPNKDTVYVYVDTADIPTDKALNCEHNAQSGRDDCTVSGGEVLHLGCTTSFEVGPDQRVAFARGSGTLCIHAESPPTSPALPTSPASPGGSATTPTNTTAAAPSMAPVEVSAAPPAVDPSASPVATETPRERRREKRKQAHP